MTAYRYFSSRTINYIHMAVIMFSSTLCCNISYAKDNWFSPSKRPEQLLELKPKKKPASLCIHQNIAGSMHIQGWHQEHIAVTISKNTYTADDAARISATLTQTEHGIITLKIEENEELRKHAYVEVTVHVPHHIALTVDTKNDVTVTQTNNTVRIKIEQGDITALTTRGALHLETERGDILVNVSHGPISAYTDRGNIHIEDSYASIKAETMRGLITATCTQIPSTARIELNTQKRGTITLTISESTEAHLIADTTRGIITSDVLINLDRQTTVLNSNAYQDLQRHIRGTIGQQATAEIKLSSTRDIHITTIDTTA